MAGTLFGDLIFANDAACSGVTRPPAGTLSAPAVRIVMNSAPSLFGSVKFPV
jgi:hypothetical protein